ncbi:MAG: acyl-CoA dehydrogenase family protein [Acidobacteria bacterium]|nr:acyl-CoA dehydrogenase family protein [Acidobacteriota bacterium]
MPSTHEVTNQPPDLVDYNLYETDPILSSTIEHYIPDVDHKHLIKLGEIAGSAEYYEFGFQANVNEPVLHTHDRTGHRIDEVKFHPSWHRLMDIAVEAGHASLPYETDAPTGSHLIRAAGTNLTSQIEQGHGCPMAMTYAVTASLRKQPDVAAEWEDKLFSRSYDPTYAPKEDKRGVLMGMAMTEKQGGSDVRSNTTSATPIGTPGPGNEYVLTGHKWFVSAPMCDAFLALAQAPGGLTCFLVPRWMPDGTRNTFNIQRLKDKLGNRSNASSEVEFDQTWGEMVGEEGRGVSTIIEMVAATRLDCVTGSAATMRQAVTQALWHTSKREAFGKVLVDQPLMTVVLADLELDVQAATVMMCRAATAFDLAEGDNHDAQMKRLLTPVAKYWVTKNGTPVIREAMECFGGGGYVEENILPRLYREAPVNAIWEGSGNVIALDVLRVLYKTPEAFDAFFTEVAERTNSGVVRSAVDDLRGAIADPDQLERRARTIVNGMGTVMAASLLEQHATEPVADAFIKTRIESQPGRLHGELPTAIDPKAILTPTLAALGI